MKITLTRSPTSARTPFALAAFFSIVCMLAPGCFGTESTNPPSDGGACNVPRALPPAGTIPSSVPWFEVYGNEFQAGSVRLVRVAPDGAETAVDATVDESGAHTGDFSVKLTPVAPLEAGAHYRVYPGACRVDPSRGEDPPFDYYVADVPFPTSIGTISFSPLSHSHWLGYYFETTVTPTAEMAAWEWAYAVRMVADGRVDAARVLVACPPTPRDTGNVSPGDVEVVVTATPLIPDVPPLSVSATAHLDCASVVETNAGSMPRSGDCSASRADAIALPAVVALIACVGLVRRRRRRAPRFEARR